MANNNEDTKRCFRHISCSKNSGHPGKCDEAFYKKINNCFWETSKPQLGNVSKKTEGRYRNFRKQEN